MFNSEFLMKYWNNRREKLCICIDDDEFHLSMLRSCDALKLSRHVRDNANGLRNHVLATSGLDFKMSKEHEKPDDNVLSVTKQLITKKISRPGTDMIVPYLVLHSDRGYWCWDLLMFLLNSCC